ncbi:hypothetical protein [Tenacibaculum xiamenense]|uniref:hypothetical protein n=1 Tax=Tenacibaculum xiamenense TaxID=1261553 RepID=UPI0038B4A569
MKKSILSLGKALPRDVQKTVQGGFGFVCPGAYPNHESTCPRGTYPFPDPRVGHSICCEEQFPY